MGEINERRGSYISRCTRSYLYAHYCYIKQETMTRPRKTIDSSSTRLGATRGESTEARGQLSLLGGRGLALAGHQIQNRAGGGKRDGMICRAGSMDQPWRRNRGIALASPPTWRHNRPVLESVKSQPLYQKQAQNCVPSSSLQHTTSPRGELVQGEL